MHGFQNQHPSVETLADILTEHEWEELAAGSSVGVRILTRTHPIEKA